MFWKGFETFSKNRGKSKKKHISKFNSQGSCSNFKGYYLLILVRKTSFLGNMNNSIRKISVFLSCSNIKILCLWNLHLKAHGPTCDTVFKWDITVVLVVCDLCSLKKSFQWKILFFSIYVMQFSKYFKKSIVCISHCYIV